MALHLLVADHRLIGTAFGGKLIQLRYRSTGLTFSVASLQQLRKCSHGKAPYGVIAERARMSVLAEFKIGLPIEATTASSN